MNFVTTVYYPPVTDRDEEASVLGMIARGDCIDVKLRLCPCADGAPDGGRVLAHLYAYRGAFFHWFCSRVRKDLHRDRLGEGLRADALLKGEIENVHCRRVAALHLARHQPLVFGVAEARRRAAAVVAQRFARRRAYRVDGSVGPHLLEFAMVECVRDDLRVCTTELAPLLARARRAHYVRVQIALAALRLPYLVAQLIGWFAVDDADQLRDYWRDATAIAVQCAAMRVRQRTSAPLRARAPAQGK